ncbi:MAG: HEAT repeat domain-containing protein, partial [Candidatus Eisenbacteria sp.]|nr:HEAT repeat domain-containing protein [Candidatus Eisenbacteria bacterium]
MVVISACELLGSYPSIKACTYYILWRTEIQGHHIAAIGTLAAGNEKPIKRPERLPRFYAEALSRAPAEAQVALLRGLADRGDPTARPAVAQVLNSTDGPVKLAAVKALGALGGVEDVAALTDLLASDDAELAG